ncbi:uncharacterized protein PRCAT00000298001 [Priceomyces carsonii]|uniref:uncharacterized protein n=1 Tax=Priceomyces carsonii TaxID=28549 RepID=UPI002ED95189|nr:unnamed protein product [Priceomyces carsonii]
MILWRFSLSRVLRSRARAYLASPGNIKRLSQKRGNMNSRIKSDHLSILLNIPILSITKRHSTKAFGALNDYERELDSLIKSKDFKDIWPIATMMKKNNVEPTPNIYLLLLKACYLTRKPELVNVALSLYCEATSLDICPDESRALTYYLLMSFQTCHDFTNLIILKDLWNNRIPNEAKDLHTIFRYHSAHLNTFLNTFQNQRAQEYFEDILMEMKNLQLSNHKELEILKTIPILRFLDVLASNKDCESLATWIQKILDHGSNTTSSIIRQSDWDKYLSTGLSQNNYKLVKLIYKTYLMKDYQNSSITTEQALFEKLESPNSFFKSITDEEVFQILHTLATNGDVNLTLSLIESHFIHKKLKGERALTNELRVKIIESYCYHNDYANDNIYQDYYNDESIKRILDVLNDLLARDKLSLLSFKEIGECMSFKFQNYKVYKESLKKSNMPGNSLTFNISDADIPEKSSNANIESSPTGNILANIKILTDFIEYHIKYLTLHKNFERETITLFINCVLNHVNLHQNFSGLIRVLLLLHNENPQFVSEWLDDDLLDIISNSLINSPGAKLCSVRFFVLLKSLGKQTHYRYANFLSAIMKGSVHDFLQFYMYHYFHDFHGYIAPEVRKVLDHIPPEIVVEDKKTIELIDFYKSLPKNRASLTKDEIEDLWSKHAFTKSEGILTKEDESNFKRKYIRSVDLRDAEYLNYILGTQNLN